MRLFAASAFFGMWGWLAGTAVQAHTGSAVLSALVFGLVVAAMVWGFDQRGKFDGF